MIRLFKHYIPNAVLLLGLFDLVLLIVAGESGYSLRMNQLALPVTPMQARIPQLLTFAGSLGVAMIAVGVYGTGALQSLRYATARLLVAISLGVIFLSVIYFIIPAATFWRSNLLYAMGIAAVLLIALRILLGKTLGGQVFKRRIV
ncbi:MAG: sugar transferase, partial [Sphingomonas sp.]